MPGSSTMTHEKVKAIIDETMKTFVEGDVFLCAIKTAVSESVKAELSDILKRVEVNEANIMDLQKRIKDQKTDITKLQKSLDTESEHVRKLQRDLNAQEQYSRRNCLRFYGVAESNGENTDDHVCRVVNEFLKIPITKNDIERSHRVGSLNENRNSNGGERRSTRKNPTKPRPIIVKFLSYRTRNLVISNRRALKGSKMGIDEDLTKENASLLKKTKDCTKVLSTWTTDGRVIALLPATGGKTIKRVIHSESDLDLI